MHPEAGCRVRRHRWPLPTVSGELVPTPDAATLDRAAMERVLARATELQAAIGDSPEALSDAQLLELGEEVGIAPEHLRQALAEEHGRGLLPPERGLLTAFAGPRAVGAARVLPGTPSSVLAALDQTMQRDEVLVLKRRWPERLSWEAQRGFIGGLRRGFALSGRSYHLTAATEIAASVAAVDAGRVHVRLVANFGDARSRRVGSSVVAAGVLIAAGAALLAMGFPPWAAALPPLLGGTAVLFAARRTYRALIARAHVALEQALDRLEYGAPKKSAAAALLDAIAPPPR